jgi:hypothetical protein
MESNADMTVIMLSQILLINHTIIKNLRSIYSTTIFLLNLAVLLTTCKM